LHYAYLPKAFRISIKQTTTNKMNNFENYITYV
jgi:hypothetical protein